MLQGTTLVDKPLEITFVAEDVAITVTLGGVVQPGETAGPAADVRTMWVVANSGGEWLLVSYQTSPLAG